MQRPSTVTAQPSASEPAPTASEPAPTASKPAPTTTGPAPAVATEPPAADVDALLAEGERLVAEGSAVEGAERFASAYQQMPASLRVAEPGRRAVVLASNAYETAWQATADTSHLAANQRLLRAYLADLEAARAAARPTMPADEHEQALRERSAAIEGLLAGPPPADAPVPAPRADPTTVEPQLELTFPPPDPRLRRNALILVGVGAAGAVAGGAMVILGAVAASRAEEQRQSMLAEEAADARGRKVAGSVTATTGAILFSGSMMMVGVGSSRLAELRREMALSLHPTPTGLALRGQF